MTTGTGAETNTDGGATTERHDMTVTLVLEKEGNYIGYGELAEEFLGDVKDIAGTSSEDAYVDAQDLYYGAIGAAICADNEQVGIYMLEAEDLLSSMGYKVAWSSTGGYRIYNEEA